MAYEKLLEPIKVGTHTYKNRMIASPIYCGTFINIPGLDKVLKMGMRKRAKGGQAQVTIGETAVNFHGGCHNNYPPIDYTDFNDPTMPKMKELVADLHQYGCKVLCELEHAGNSLVLKEIAPFGLGPVDEVLPNGFEIHAMTVQDMADVTQDFVNAALWLKEAGCDGVQIHAGHGWLIHQFLSERVNTRTDEFGGSLENRAKFPLQILKAVREAVGKDFILEMRVSGEEKTEPVGMDANETAAFSKMAEPYIDMVHISVGIYRDPILSGQFSSMFDPHGLNMNAAKTVKDAVNIPVAMVGGITDAETAEKLIAEGYCDIVAMGRQLTADPDFAKKVTEGHADDIMPCIRCYKCFPSQIEDVSLDELPYLFGCTVNPKAFFYDEELLNKMPEEKKNVLIIGGGMAGMAAAITAADKGHKVTLVEKKPYLGGLLFFTDTDPIKVDMNKMKNIYAYRTEHNSNITVVKNHEFTAADLETYKPDVVFIAVGSSPVAPPIKGIENAYQALELYPDNSFVGQNVVMVGGGLVGCEVGLDLVTTGRKVTVIEMGPKVAPDSYAMHREALMREMKKIDVRCSLKCSEIRKDGITAIDADGNEIVINGDTVVYALGMKANLGTVEAIKEMLGDIPYEVIGDAGRAAKVFEANRQGMIAALNI